ncbi:MAG TPA: hypothetical protein PKU82_03305 [Bacteroidia bacterium]|nr:hypothetical protein [Bacteroidia bacterium]HOZ90680.1 hypothetical protein [Bacteroidia bacterium]
MGFRVMDAWFDLSYGGLSISLEELYAMPYDNIYSLLMRMDIQKKHEKAEMDKAKHKK